MRIGQWQVHRETNEIHSDEQTRKLSPLAMEVLCYFASRADRVVTHQELLDIFWQDKAVSDNALHKIVSELRSAFGDNSRAPDYIATVPKRGYRLMAEVSESESATPSLVGQSADLAEVVQRALTEGKQCQERWLFDLAIYHYDIAVTLLERDGGEPDQLCDAYLAIGDCKLADVGKEAARDWYDKAERLAKSIQSHQKYCRALVGQFGGMQPLFTAELSDIQPRLRQALEEVPETDSLLANRVRSALISCTRPADVELIETARVNAVAARNLGDPEVLGYALITQHELLSMPDHLNTRKRISDEARGVCIKTHNRDLVTDSFLRSVGDALEGGDLAKADAVTEELRMIEPQHSMQDDVNRILASRHIMSGRLASAERLALGIRVRETPQTLIQLLQLFQIRRAQGRLHELTPIIESQIDAHADLPVIRSYLALCYAETGDRESALRTLDPEQDASRMLSSERDASWTAGFTSLVDSCCLLENETLAEALLPLAQGHIDLHLNQGAICYFGAGHFFYGRLLAVLKRYEPAREHLQIAATQHQQMDAEILYFKALNALEQVEMSGRLVTAAAKTRRLAQGQQKKLSDLFTQ